MCGLSKNVRITFVEMWKIFCQVSKTTDNDSNKAWDRDQEANCLGAPSNCQACQEGSLQYFRLQKCPACWSAAPKVRRMPLASSSALPTPSVRLQEIEGGAACDQLGLCQRRCIHSQSFAPAAGMMSAITLPEKEAHRT